MPDSLPDVLYSCEQARTLDSLAISEANIPGIVLMKRAGKAAFDLIFKRWPDTQKLLIICGGGNNGGDGYVVAGLAAQRNLQVELYSVVDVSTLEGDAEKAKDYALAQGLSISALSAFFLKDISLLENTIVVDAMLGIGFQGGLRVNVNECTKKINACSLPVIALDIPSGLNGDTGAADKDAIQADVTMTFVGVKQGLLTGYGPDFSGDIHFDDLGIPQEIYTQLDSDGDVTQRVSSVLALTSRKPSAYKNNFGHVLVIGGDLGMGGAAILAAEAVMRTGAGLVSVATQKDHVAAALARLPEAMVKGIQAGPELEDMMDEADVVIVGPGLGQSGWSQQMLVFALQGSQPKVMDAGALSLLAEEGFGEYDSSNWVITPHPGEASRLLSMSTQDIQADRFSAVKSLQKMFGGVAVLKGAGTLICDGDSTSLAQVGNPGMAVAGMGDVLSGVIAGLLAQKHSLKNAAINGVCAHGAAGDRAAEAGIHGLRASDLMPHLRSVLNGEALSGSN